MSINNKFSSNEQPIPTISTYLRSSGQSTFFNLLNTPSLYLFLEESIPKHRNRLYSPITTLSMFLAQTLNSDGSCQNIVNARAIDRMNAGLSPGSTLTGA